MTNKESFINYSKNRIEDLNNIKKDITATILMTGNVRDFGLVKIIRTEEDSDNFTCMNTKNEIVCDTLMITPLAYACRLEFEKIDTEFYNNIIEYWDDLQLDEYFTE